MARRCDGWCGPAVVYAVLASVSAFLALVRPNELVRGIPVSGQVRMAGFLVAGLHGAVWTAVLYWLCSWCHNDWAWFLLLFPFLIILLLFVMLVTMAFTASYVKGRRIQVPITYERMANYDGQGYRYAPQFASVTGSTFPDEIRMPSLEVRGDAEEKATYKYENRCNWVQPGDWNKLSPNIMRTPMTYMQFSSEQEYPLTQSTA